MQAIKENIGTIHKSFPLANILASIGVILSLISPDYIWILIIALVIVSLSIFLKEKFILFFILVLLLVFVGEISPIIRLIIQLSAISFLFFINLKKYGVDFYKYPKIPPSILGFILLLYTALAISILYSDYSYAGIPLVIRLSFFFIFVYLFYGLIDSIDFVKLYINAIIISAVIVAFGTLYDFLQTGLNLMMIAGEIYRTGGFIKNYNATGGYFAIAIPLLISSLYITRVKIKRHMMGIIIALLFIAMIITGSRSALLACTVSVFIVLYILNKKLLIRITVSLVLIILVLLIFDPSRELLFLVLRLGSGLTQRDQLWEISLGLINHNFFFGIGPGAYAFKMIDYFPVMLNSYHGQRLIGLFEMTDGRNSAHNFYLVMFTDLGILGFMASIMLPYIFYRISKIVIKHLKELASDSYYIIVGVAGSMSGLLFRALFDGINILTYGWVSSDLPFWLMFSILIYYYNDIYKSDKFFVKV